MGNDPDTTPQPDPGDPLAEGDHDEATTRGTDPGDDQDAGPASRPSGGADVRNPAEDEDPDAGPGSTPDA